MKIIIGVLLLIMLGGEAAHANQEISIEPRHAWFRDDDQSRPAILEFYQTVFELTRVRFKKLASPTRVSIDDIEASLATKVNVLRQQWQNLNESAQKDETLTRVFQFAAGDIFIIRPTEDLDNLILGKGWEHRYHQRPREAELREFFPRWIAIHKQQKCQINVAAYAELTQNQYDELVDAFKAIRLYEEFGKGLLKLYQPEPPAEVATERAAKP